MFQNIAIGKFHTSSFEEALCQNFVILWGGKWDHWESENNN